MSNVTNGSTGPTGQLVAAEETRGSPSTERFNWLTFDVASVLPDGWQEELKEVARRDRVTKQIVPPHSTSREGQGTPALQIMTVRGVTLSERLPWVVDLYRGYFRDLYQDATGVKIYPAEDKRYAVLMNVQEGTDRYECHVDTNPVEALLYVTDHPRGSGGDLVVANDVDAHSTAEVDRDCSVLHPVGGQIVFFDARRFPHYVRAMRDPGLRVAVAMNYYTDECPEATRPADLNEYLYGPTPAAP